MLNEAMAVVRPFRALRYNPDRVRVAAVITQPYDKISPDMRRRYYASSPYNLVRIILGDPEVECGGGARDIYEAAALHFGSWRRDGILQPDPDLSFYAYSQRFVAPGSSEELERLGFIALGRLHDYSEHVVYCHEQTLAKPKADRLNLLRATRAHFGQLFMLYRDPTGEIAPHLAPASAPDIDIRDEYGVQHRVWRISDPATVAAVTRLMSDKKLIIADGHHRYETALTYRDEISCRRHAAEAPGAAAHEFVMMTFINMDSPGVVILPTHRVVSGLAGFDRDLFLRRMFAYGAVEKAPAPSDVPAVLAALRDSARQGAAFVAVIGGDAYLIRPSADTAATILADVSQRQRRLDVVVLHKLLLEHVLGLSEESIRLQENLSYVRDAGEAIQRVRSGANISFLMNPLRMDQLAEVAFAGEVLPQKSTDFYPKLLSGLTIYALE